MMSTPAFTVSNEDLLASIASHPLTIAPTACVMEAIAQMAAADNACLLVSDINSKLRLPLVQAQRSCVLVQEGDRLVGIMTERDLLRLSGLGKNLAEVAIAEVMSAPVLTLNISELTDLGVPLALFHQYSIRHLPVVNDRGKVVGVLTDESLRYLLIQERTRAMQEQIERERLLAQMATQIHASLNLSEVLDATVTALRDILQCDRTLVYQFQPDWSGIIVAESVGEGWKTALGNRIDDCCFQAQAARLHGAERTITIDNVYRAGYSSCHLALLEQYQVKANLVVPILVSDQLWGLLIGHQCGDYRSWRDRDLTLLDEIAVQLAIAIQQASTHQQLQEELKARQQAEMALRNSETELRSLFAAMDDVVIVIDRDGRYLKIPSTHSKKLYRPSQELLGRSLQDFFPDEQVTLFLTCIQQALATGQTQEYIYCLLIEETEVWFNAKCSPLTPETVLWVARDITEQQAALRERQRAELQLQQQQALLRAIIDTTPNKIFVKDWNGCFLLVNKAIAESYHTTIDALLGKTGTDFDADPALITRFLQENRAVITHQTSLFIPEEKSVSMSGEEQWFQWQKHPINLPGKNTLAVLGVGVDITSHKQTQAILHQYERVVSTTTDGIALLNCNYVYQLVNQVYLDWHAKQWDEMVGHSIAELLGETVFQTLVKPRLDRCIAGEIQHEETWVNDRQRFVRITYSPYIELDGTIAGVIISTHDLTAIKQAEATIEEREQFLRSIYEGVEQVIFTVDVLENGDFCFVDFNPAAERLTGYSTTQMQGKLAGEKVRQHYTDCVQAGVSITYEECLVFQDTPSWWLTTLNPIRDAASRIYRIVGTSTNLTQRKQAELLLEIQTVILEQIAKGEPLPVVLNALICSMEGLLNQASCSILFCDDDGRLHHGCAPHLPSAYIQAIDGVAIGEGVGSCGTAAFRRATVIVSDIATDPLWQNYRELALEHGLAACWSVPVITSDGRVLGTFAVYHRDIYTPNKYDLIVVALAANIAGIAIERDQATQALEQLNRELEHRVEERTSALRSSEERWQLALRGANDGIWDWDLTTNKVFFSSRWKQMRGLADDAIGDSPDECISRMHPDDYDRVMAAVNDHFAGKTEFFEVEYRSRHKDGSYMWVLDRAQALRNESGQVVRISGSETDISDRKQAEAELSYSRDLREAVFNESADALFLVDPETLLTLDCNQRATQLFEVEDKADLIGIEGHTLQHHPFSDEELVQITVDMQCNGFWSRELEYVTHWGRIFWGNIAAKPITVAGRTLNLVRVTDISDRKRLEQEQRQLIAILEASTDYISMSDLEGNIIWNNTALKQICGLENNTIVRQRQIASYHPQWAVDLILNQGLPTAIATGSWIGESALLDVEGREIPLSQLILAHKSPQGDVEFFSTIARDMRTRKEYEQRLERTNAELLRATRLKDEFLANMSHELRTPLNAILGMSEGLQDEVFGTLNDRQKKAIATVERSGRHLLELINDILEVSKIAAGKLTLDISRVSIDHLCASSLVFVKQQAFKKQIQLTTVLPTDLGDIAVDERRMLQVLINLLNNAVKFTPEGGKVTLEVHHEPIEINLAERISVKRPEPPQRVPTDADAMCRSLQNYYLCISVIDTGIGIAAADQSKLFQPFIQLDSNLNRHYEGTGLGLTLVKQIVELHGGSVGLRSELGQGSCFTVRLPYNCRLEDKPTGVTLPSTANSHPSGDVTLGNTISGNINLNDVALKDCSSGEAIATLDENPLPNILLAEDNEANINTVSSYLGVKGYSVLVARNGQEAIALAQIHYPDLILMDIQMPGMDGLETIQMIRQNPSLAKTPIIALTALVMQGDRERCLNAGATAYLAKPVRLKELSQLIQTLLAL
ncbi:MAG: PAS domain S-box protein [Oculatellaceae cyanobacterium bins.114]|nr:PAS domain S-box protein [Oculatellaceae cyanobacterium bins.114]